MGNNYEFTACSSQCLSLCIVFIKLSSPVKTSNEVSHFSSRTALIKTAKYRLILKLQPLPNYTLFFFFTFAVNFYTVLLIVAFILSSFVPVMVYINFASLIFSTAAELFLCTHTMNKSGTGNVCTQVITPPMVS